MQISRDVYITDKVGIALEASKSAISSGMYVPILNMPRVFRNDWRNEVQKRLNSISCLQIDNLHVDSEDVICTIKMLERYGFNVVESDPSIDSLPYVKDDPIRLNKCNLDDLLSVAGYSKINLENGKELHRINVRPDGEVSKLATLLVLEMTGNVLDVAAINYAWIKGYDVYLIESISEDVENVIISIIDKFDGNVDVYDDISKELNEALLAAGSAADLGSRYDRVQYVVKSVPLGLTSTNQITAHLMHVDCEIKLLDCVTNRVNISESSVMPSYLFVDLEADGLISEIPEIVNDVSRKHSWRFYLNGGKATISKFKTFCHFFPLDCIVVSGHGTSPMCRIVVYEYIDELGLRHTAKIREYYQFLRVDRDGLIEVETKQQFLMFDDIDFADKQKLRDKGVSPRAFIESSHQKVLHEESVAPEKVEGLALANGVFMGNISFFANFACPLVLLNTCGSMRTVGPLLSFAGARSVIGTAWSVFDVSAREFAEEFFQSLDRTGCVSEALHLARQRVDDVSSGMAYWMLGTLDTVYKTGLQEYDERRQSDVWLKRIIGALSLAVAIHKKGWLREQDLEELEDVYRIAEELCNRDPESKRRHSGEIRELRESLDRM